MPWTNTDDASLLFWTAARDFAFWASRSDGKNAKTNSEFHALVKAAQAFQKADRKEAS